MRNAEKQPEVVRFVTGIDQSGGTRGAQPGTFELVKNMRFQSGGLQKRAGSTAVTGETIGTAHHLADTASNARPTEKAAFIGRIGDQKVSGTSSGDAFEYAGAEHRFQGCFSAAQPVRRRLGIGPASFAKPVGPEMPACAVTSDGYLITASGFANELRIVVESPTGAVLFQDSVIVGAAVDNITVRIVSVGAIFFLCYQGSASATINVRTLTVASGAITDGGTATLATTNGFGKWDLSAYDGTTWFLVYQSGATTVTISERNTSATEVDSVTFATTDNATYLSIWADPVTDRIWVGSVDDPTGASTADFRVYTDDLTLSVGPTTLGSGGGATTGVPLFGPRYTRSPTAGDAFYVFGQRSAAGLDQLMCGTVSAGTPTTARAAAWNLVAISKPDAQQRVWCVSALYNTVPARLENVRVMLVRIEDAASLNAIGGPTPIVELASPEMESSGTARHPSASSASFHAVAVTTESAGGSTFFALPFVVTSRTISGSPTPQALIRCDTYEYTRHNQEPHRQLQPLGRSGVVSGQPTELYGQPSASTTASTGAVEIGFAHRPALFLVTATPAGNGLAAGTYVYFTNHQWVDDEGNRHLSAPSQPYTVTLTEPSSVAFQIAGVYAGQRPNVARGIADASPTTLLWRTQNGGTDAQLVPLSTAEPAAAWSGYVTVTDTVADSVIDDNEFIYTAGGVLPNVLAPSCRYIAVSEERLWCGGLWDSNIIECSKIRVPGEPFNFTGHASHQVVIPGEVTGLAYMDGQVVAFTEDAIYLVGGDGPNDQGSGGFAPPRALVRGVGCPREQSASILETEIGILFRSKMGLYVIPRGFGSPQFIGVSVDDEDELVLSAATTTTVNYRLARFLVTTTGGTKSSKVLTLDLTNMQWVRDEYTVDGTITGQGFSEIGEWPDGLALMSYGLDRADNPNVIWAEDEDETGDAGAAGAGATTYISQYARTNWIQPGGPGAECRCTYALLSCEPIGSSSALTLLVETDANADQSKTWTITNSDEVAYRAMTVKEPQCTEFRCTISDAAGASNSAGVRLLAVAFETHVVGGVRRVTDSEGET